MAKKTKSASRQPEETTPDATQRREYDVTPQQFISVWEASETAEEVAKTLKMPKPIVHARASSYRQAGIKLKKMKRHSTKALDVDELNRLIEGIRAEQGAKADPGGDGKEMDEKVVQEAVKKVMQTLHPKK